MSEPDTARDVGASTAPATTPGQLIRQAREATGLHIVALAAALKVPVRKLEALETNRWDELTDATFTRALASSVARHLKMDATPVLMGLPSAKPVALTSPAGLGHVGQGAASASVGVLAPALSLARHSWMVAVLLIGAVALYFSPEMPQIWRDVAQPITADATAADVSLAKGTSVSSETVARPMQAGSPVAVAAPLAAEDTQTLAKTAPAPEVSSPPAIALVDSAQPGVALLSVAASQDTWIEVTDSGGRLRIQRVLKQGEDVTFGDGAPYSVVVGNAAGARVLVRGQAMDLAVLTKNNVARFEVK
jgi:cytoskeleton protein RodZ